jgi:hypothetical protein
MQCLLTDGRESPLDNVHLYQTLDLLFALAMLTWIRQFSQALQGEVLQLFSCLQCAAELFFPER